MIHIYIGSNVNVIKRKIDELINELNIDNIIKYDVSECSFNDVLDEVSYIDLFNEKKLVIVSSLSFKKISIEEENRFIAYMHSDNMKENELIIKCIDESLDERKKLTKQIKENTNLNIIPKLDYKTLHQYITNMFKEKNINITYNQVKRILDLCEYNPDITINETEKLLIYLNDKNNVNDIDIEEVISINYEKEIYNIVEYVLKKDIKNCLNSYKILIKSNIDITIIVDAIAKEIRSLYQLKNLYGSMSEQDLSRKIGIKEFKIGKMMQYAREYKNEELLDLMYKLSEVDEKVKSYNIDKNKVMEMFFINL